MEAGDLSVIVDTSALSAIADERDRIREVLGTAAALAIPVIAIGKCRSGIALSRDAARYREWLDEFILASQMLEIDESATHHYADIVLEIRRIGKPIPTNDVWIAALYGQHGLLLLSKDHHFDVVNRLQRIEW